jgi:hypothetical protein
VVVPVVAATKASITTVLSPSDLVTPKACVSQRRLTIHVVRHVNGMKITSAKVLLAKAIELVQLSRDSGYDRAELLDIIKQLP